jgi:hypothetical protein
MPKQRRQALALTQKAFGDRVGGVDRQMSACAANLWYTDAELKSVCSCSINRGKTFVLYLKTSNV